MHEFVSFFFPGAVGLCVRGGTGPDTLQLFEVSCSAAVAGGPLLFYMRLIKFLSLLSSLFSRRTVLASAGADLAAVCAVLGGVLGQDIVKAISQHNEPITNVFTFNGPSSAFVSAYKSQCALDSLIVGLSVPDIDYHFLLGGISVPGFLLPLVVMLALPVMGSVSLPLGGLGLYKLKLITASDRDPGEDAGLGSSSVRRSHLWCCLATTGLTGEGFVTDVILQKADTASTAPPTCEVLDLELSD